MMHDKIAVPGMKAPRVKGHMSLELRDAETGELSQRFERDNYVAEQWFTNINMAMQYDFARIANSSNEGFDSSNEGFDSARSMARVNGSRFIFDKFPFAGLLLTDNAKAVDTTDTVPEGVLAGGASKNSVSAGTLNGTYNAAESEHTPFYHRFVYDFATTQGNGTIQSIYTGNFDGSSDDRLDYSPLWFWQLDQWNSSGVHCIAADPVTGVGLRLESVSSNSSSNPPTSLGFLTKEQLLYSNDSSSKVSVSFPVEGGTVNAITTYGNRIAWLGDTQNHDSASRTLTVYSALWADVVSEMDTNGDLSGLTTQVEHTFTDAELDAFGWTSDSFGYSRSLRMMTYIAESDTFLLGNAVAGVIAGAPESAIYEFSASDWSLLNELGACGDLSGAFALEACVGTADSVWTCEGLLYLDRSGSALSRTMGYDSGYSDTHFGLPTQINKYMAINQRYTSSGSDFSKYIINPQHFFSRVRLDSPVVKDNTNTMKVVYEFTITEPDLTS